MEVVHTYSHFGGSEILEHRYPELDDEINQAIEAIDNPGRGKVSKESRTEGEEFFSPTELNEAFEEQLLPLNWGIDREYYTTSIPDYEHEITGSYNEYDFQKEEIFIEVQMGKYFAMFYDLAKFQNLYNAGRLEVGVEIVPSHFLYKQMSSGVSYGEKLIYDLERIGSNFPQVPVKIILMDMPLDGTDYMLEERKKVRDLED